MFTAKFDAKVKCSQFEGGVKAFQIQQFTPMTDDSYALKVARFAQSPDSPGRTD